MAPNSSQMDLCVLLVEDDELSRRCVQSALQSCGYKVIAAENGKVAMDILKTGQGDCVDMILTDILMPEVDGLQLLDRVTHSDKWKQLPVTVMSTHDGLDTAADCIQKGAVEFIAKPVRKHKISNLWQHVMRKKRDTPSTAPVAREAGEQPGSIVAGATNGASLPNGANGTAAPQQAPELPSWIAKLPQAIVEIAFNPNARPVASPQRQRAHMSHLPVSLPHSDNCSAFSAFMRRREEGTFPPTMGSLETRFPGALAAMGQPVQVSNLSIVQQGLGGGMFRGSGMLTLHDSMAKRANAERATQRRAEAIEKFRAKKKARTFKKKVRYESRKRLAEQRPRIKGQFVKPEVAAAAAATAAAAAAAAKLSKEQ